jgi:protein-S-isoprenylcysteine O-methyltransferase Ste14
MRVGRNQKGWDKLFLVAINIMFLAWWLAMPLDAVRFHASHVPIALRVAGVLATVASARIFFVTFRENPFLSGVVRIQEERGHKVITTGPYRYVRHPMYAGALLLFVGVPLWLGSWWGLLLGVLASLLMAARAVLEERTLARELDGYEAYRRTVRWRLVPYLW